MHKNNLLNKVSTIIYAVVGILVGFYLYQYMEYAFYIVGIVLSFLALNKGVFYWYKKQEKSNAVMKFMGINFLKDFIWAVFWMFMLKKNEVITIYLVLIFLLLSIPLYISVINGIKNNQKYDKNQS